MHISSVLYVAVRGRIVGIVGIVGSVRGLALRIVAERGAIELPGRPECTGRLERLASQALRTDRSEFRKERHTGCRTEC